jgi:uncharacterized membrane protein YeiH
MGAMPGSEVVVDPTGDVMFTLLSVFGTMAFAVSGAAAAMRVGMDLVGVAVLALLTAVGGGSLRDVVLGNLPMWWVADSWAVFLALGFGLLLVPFRRRFSAERAPDSWRVVIVADALGLGAFCVIGSAVTLSMGFPVWLAVAMGVLTGVGGGVLRDVLANTKPLVFTGQVYATAALAGSLAFVVLNEVGWGNRLSYWLPALAVVTIRMVAIARRWEFPALEIGR